MRRQSQLRFARKKKKQTKAYKKKSKGEKQNQVDMSWRRMRRMKGFCTYREQVKHRFGDKVNINN